MAEEVLTAVASYGLPGTGLALPARPLADPDWSSFIDAVARGGLCGHLADAVNVGAFPVSAQQMAEVQDLHRAAMWHVMRLERRLADIGPRLSAAGVRAAVLKGSAYAHTVYPSPSLRVFSDLDLLVSSAQVPDAERVLQELGFAALGRRRAPAETSALLTDAGGVGVDLQSHLVPRGFPELADASTALATSTTFSVAGEELLCLAPPTAFLHSCFRIYPDVSAARLVAVRDVAQQVLSAGFDRAAVLALAHAWGAEAVVAGAVRHVWETFEIADLVPLSEWAQRYVPTAAEQRALADNRQDASAGGLAGWRTRLLRWRNSQARAAATDASTRPEAAQQHDSDGAIQPSHLTGSTKWTEKP